ncbi:glycosyltransferase family 4 protein [Pelotomaculum propionicicum]|uniref:glycosyltransferase family 4 protein n=1 Tax=Pelotomaculum propionicicum TaxID=258475 RepID=UPI003BA3CF0F
MIDYQMTENTFNTIWFLCHYAQQPPYNTMLRYHNWGKQLVKRGCNVVIIAASTVHNTDIDVVDKIGKTECVCDGVRYLYVKAPEYSGNGVQRVKNMIKYCFGLSKFSKRVPKPDAIVICGAYVFPFAKIYFKGIPIITDIFDLWPESIVEYAGMSEKNPIVQVLYGLEKKAYLQCDAIIFSMEGGKDYLKERKYSNKIDYSKVFHINMGCDMEEVDRNREIINDPLPWDMRKFNIVYCGSIRQANNVQQICDAAKELEKRGINDVAFQIYGNGDELDALKAYIEVHSISNVKFYGRIEKAKIPHILSNAKANILTYKQVPLMKYGGSQSKLFDYLSSGKPIICNAKFGYNLITRYDCGVVTENQTPEAFADAVEKLYQLPKEAMERMGANARQAANDYDQPVLVDKLYQVINYVIAKSGDNRA